MFITFFPNGGSRLRTCSACAVHRAHTMSTHIWWWSTAHSYCIRCFGWSENSQQRRLIIGWFFLILCCTAFFVGNRSMWSFLVYTISLSLSREPWTTSRNGRGHLHPCRIVCIKQNSDFLTLFLKLFDKNPHHCFVISTTIWWGSSEMLLKNHRVIANS